MYCPTCGQLNQDAAIACAHCGRSLPERAVVLPPPPLPVGPAMSYDSPLPEVPPVSYTVPESPPVDPYPWGQGASGGPQASPAPSPSAPAQHASFAPPPPPPAPGPQDYRSSYDRPASPYVTHGYQPSAPPMPSTYLWQSVVVLLLCCLPLGIVALVFAIQVSSRHQSGDYAGAVDASGKARTWATVAFIAGLLFYVLNAFLIAVGAVSGYAAY